MKKSLSAAFIVLLIVFSLSTLTACSTSDAFPELTKISEQTFDIPGLKDDFVQQGVCYIPSANKFAVCGYMTDGSASRIYITGINQEATYVTLKNTDGANYTGHAGGIAYAGDFLWVSNAGKVWQVKVNDVLSAEKGAAVTFVKSVEVESRASFVFCAEESLWVGDFAYGDNYETPDSHKLITPTKENYNGLVCEYKLTNKGEFADTAETPTPVKVLSIRDQIQGFARLTDGRCVLSRSYGANFNSHIFVYKADALSYPKDTKEEDKTTITINGSKVPLFFLTDDKIEQWYQAPPMTEDLEVADGKVYVMLESASKKFVKTAFYPQSKCLALTIPVITPETSE